MAEIGLPQILAYLGGGAGLGAMTHKGGRDFLFGQGMNKVDTMTKEQKALLSQMMQMLGGQGGLGQGMQEGIDLQRQLMDPNSL